MNVRATPPSICRENVLRLNVKMLMWNQPVNKAIKQTINESNKQAANNVIYLCVKRFSCILSFITPSPNMVQHLSPHVKKKKKKFTISNAKCLLKTVQTRD